MPRKSQSPIPFDAFSFDDDDTKHVSKAPNTARKLISMLGAEDEKKKAPRKRASVKDKKDTKDKTTTRSKRAATKASAVKASNGTKQKSPQSSLTSTKSSPRTSSNAASKKRKSPQSSLSTSTSSNTTKPASRKRSHADPYEFNSTKKRRKITSDPSTESVSITQILKQKKKKRDSSASLDDLAHFEDILDYDDELEQNDDSSADDEAPVERFKQQRLSTGSNSSNQPSKRTQDIQRNLAVISSLSNTERQRTGAAQFLLEAFFDEEFMVYLRAHDLVGETLRALHKSSEIHAGELHMVTIQMLCAVLSDAQNLAVVTRSELKAVVAILQFLERHAKVSNEQLVDEAQPLGRDILSLSLRALTQVGKLQGDMYREIAADIKVDFLLLHSILNRLLVLIQSSNDAQREKHLRDAQGIFLFFEHLFFSLTDYEHHQRLLQEMFDFFHHFSTVDFGSIGDEFSGSVECCVSLLHMLTNVSNNNADICALVHEKQVVQQIGRIFSANAMRHYDLVVSILAVFVNLGQAEVRNYEQLLHITVKDSETLPQMLLKLARFTQHAADTNHAYAKFPYSTEGILAIEMYAALLLAGMLSKLDQVKSISVPSQEIGYIVDKVTQFMQIQLAHGLATDHSVQTLSSMIKTLKNRRE